MQKIKRTVHSAKRVNLINKLVENLTSNKIFSGKTNRRKESESTIQRSLFLDLEDNLEDILMSHFDVSKKRAKIITDTGFQWEQKTTTSVSNFPFFSRQHRPDSVLKLYDGFRIAIELKKGDSGATLRAGIGQALVYSTQYNFVIYIYVDMTPKYDIRSSVTGAKESHLISSLWSNQNIKFVVV